ncbi:Chemotaxis protein methyltransferase CheR [Paramagnetospirillum magnetotacticum MS-1]|uniref:Chemotaxis protein methyltransferase CheR n=1 Tax=Paramagnetospirillum magnetotacticum MS-1 TaxID=272627 RepID=A0A0C2UVH3_PARME|nr:protein-glutamate O-methyltransferase CheR [Paramagnetospirillum magnetotacticum]KIL96831.1 Chemotaxis protein methyltransferase CheR [Paramagnetospirillum magnetotacticum MS-1]
MPSRSDGLRALEVDLFVEALARRHGYDFSQYAKASLRRRVSALAQSLGCATIADLLPRVLHDEALLPAILSTLSVPVTEMFRDPLVFRAIAERLLPVLATYPRLNIWQAGSATGEEAYSLAILLEEAGLLQKAQIYATDINDTAIAKAEEGIVSAEHIARYEDAYRKAGGNKSLSHYFSQGYGFAKISSAIKDHISFAHHNLVSDGVFCEVNMVVCRNVLIYFDKKLQDHVLGLFGSSLSRGGFLCLGLRENLGTSAHAHQFMAVDHELRLFRKAGGSQ